MVLKTRAGNVMQTQSAFLRLGAAILLAAFGAAGSALAQDATGPEIAQGAYQDQTLTGSEREAITQEEDVTPNDGRPSVPSPGDQAIIPDAADPEKGDTTVDATSDGALPGDVHTKGAKPDGSETNVILDDATKNFKVTQNEYQRCLRQWVSQTQLS
jgi:hypothetical protein